MLPRFRAVVQLCSTNRLYRSFFVNCVVYGIFQLMLHEYAFFIYKHVSAEYLNILNILTIPVSNLFYHFLSKDFLIPMFRTCALEGSESSLYICSYDKSLSVAEV